MNLQGKYARDDFISFLQSFIPQYSKDIRPVHEKGLKATENASYLGESRQLELSVFELTHTSSNDARVTLARDGFRIMKNSAVYRALIVYQQKNNDDWRLSLMTAIPDVNQKGKIIQKLSNPRRFSFFLGPNAKIHTPKKYLTGRVKDFDELKKRFSIEVVNKEFFAEISILFSKLAGGERYIGSKKISEKSILKLPSETSHRKKQEFATRLLGRIIFCWFLKKKQSLQGKSLIPDCYLSKDSVLSTNNYYHDILEPLFFQHLNMLPEQRRDKYKESVIPFLNGGLFQPHNDDFYEVDSFTGFSKFYNVLHVPNKWFRKLFQVLEMYNFTIDESTSIDIELSIDPEMLGRIFENLLAEINPETGKTARKATGSYYTPRPIVEYMVDESLKHYLAKKTTVDVLRISQILAYDKDLPNLSEEESKLIIKSLYHLKIIDPACGSGAFPMGVLQKVVLILQKIDPGCRRWLDEQISRVKDMHLHNVLKEKLKNENLDYIRKLGVIQNTIYGVDIQPIAVEIAKLRFFLSLIVDEDVDDAKDNRGLQPLPNLEFKFICANSLIELNDPFQASFLKNKFFETFESLSKNFFAASDPKKKNDIRKGIEILIKKKVDDNFTRVMNITKTSITEKKFEKQLHQKHKKTISRLSYEAELWGSYLNIFKDEPVDFFNPRYFFPEAKQGFDIVIANPPYIGESGHKDLFRELRKNKWINSYYKGKMDIFYLFFHRSLDLVKNGGIVAFITTNYYITASGAFKLRKDFYNRTSILNLINFNELKIFPSALGQHNMITILKKDATPEQCKSCITKRVGLANSDILSSIVNGDDDSTDYFQISQDQLYDMDKFYIRLQDISSRGNDVIGKILDKIGFQSFSLGNICNINQGVVSGCDYVSRRNIHKLKHINDIVLKDGIFVFDLHNKRDFNTIKSFSNVERRLLRPFFKNSDIRQYYCKLQPEKLLLYISKNIESLQEYPTIKQHLARFMPILKDRREVRQGKLKYFHLQWARSEVIFRGSKICVPYRTEVNSFAYNEIPWFCRSDSYIITSKNSNFKLKYILSLLNSRLYYFWLYYKGKRKGKILELFQTPLSEIPLKEIPDEAQKSFIEIVNTILSLTQAEDYLKDQSKQQKVKEYQEQINQMIYRLYGLTQKEIEIVEGFDEN
ncbi:MAG: Eco57I restriction-modification methylase domain-containing protein [Candidatus Marinimicrobia bacterium]|nr:Eco57I restriction-modification methylase domain-containing protein [Candidatus Neomarinimicrobiota bacterium]